jgi:hypothetical protein
VAVPGLAAGLGVAVDDWASSWACRWARRASNLGCGANFHSSCSWLAAQHPVLPPSLYRLYCHSVPQVLDVGGQDCEPDISGIDFSPSGRRLYVGTEGSITGG